MRRQQAAILGDGIFPWTTRSVSVCWGCALQHHRRVSYRSASTESRDGKLRPGRHGSRFTTGTSSAHGGFIILNRPLTTRSPAAWSDRGKPATQSCSKPASNRIPPLPTELDGSYYGSGRSKQLGRRGATQDLSKTEEGASSKAQLLKPSRVSNQNHNGSPDYDLSHNGSSTSKHGKTTANPKREFEQTLDDALDYWVAQNNVLRSKPLHALHESDATNVTTGIRPKLGLNSVLPRFARSLELQTASHRHEVGKLHSRKLTPLEARRSIQTFSPRLTAAAPSQQTITPGEVPADLLPRFEVGSKTPIREHLRLWQELNKDEEVDDYLSISDHGKPGGVENMLTRPADSDTMLDTMDNEEAEGPWPEASIDQDGVTEFDSDMPFLRCGDLVELSPSTANQESVLAIYIRTFDTQAQFYTMYGKWIHKLAKIVYFSIPGFVTRSSVAEILPYLPSEEVPEELKDKLYAFDLGVPREAGAKILHRMREFFNASEAAYRKHSSSLDNAHSLVAHETEITYMTLAEIAFKVLPPSAKPSRSQPWPKSMLYALHRILLRNEFGFGVDRTGHRVSALFEIRPKQEVESVNQVRCWLREYQEHLVTAATTDKPNIESPDAADMHPLAVFVSKARRLIAESREHRVPMKEGNVGPSPVRLSGSSNYVFRAVPSVRFSEADKSIIRFFEVWAGYRSFFRHVPLNSLGSMILRVIGMYDGYELDHPVGWLFLQELGVYVPWENRMILNHKLGLPGHGITPEADQMRYENIRVAKSTRVMEDKMKAFRKDWGDLEVLCIDHVDAREIDDGISVEEIPGSESTYWVHVHVANPSAFISPESTLAKYAEYLTETVYLPERIYTMLPPHVTRTQLSLAPGRPALTFSAKVNKDGEFLEVKVTPAYVRNVSYLTPQTIRNAFVDHTQRMPQTIITVGGDMPSRGRRGIPQTLTESQKHQLRIFQKLGDARRRQRERKGAVHVHIPLVDTVVYLGPRQDTPVSLTSRARGCHYEGDPVIQLRGDHFDPKPDRASTGVDQLVPDMMMLACEAAALWCKERNIPILYRATTHNPDYDPRVYWKAVVEPTIEKLGYLPLVLSFQYSRLLGKSVVLSTPKPHGVIGADQYTKCTSPLRRYGDLIVHWQIESAIRREAEIGRTLVGSQDESYLTFSKQRIDEMIPRIHTRERMITGVKRHSLRHWTVQLLFRAFYFKEAALPETFTCFIFSKGAAKYAGMYSGILQALGIDVQVVLSESAKEVGVEVGDWWEVKIIKVDTYVRAVTVEIVGLIEKGEGYSSSDSRIRNLYEGGGLRPPEGMMQTLSA